MKKGFTLIELLVVIAIIGLLSSVVLASLRSAGNKGSNAAVKENLSNMRAQAALFYEESINKNYVGLCSSGSLAYSMFLAAVSAGGTTGTPSCAVGGSGTQWAASVQLKIPEGSNNYWCVDWTGASKGHPSATAASTCP